jgi:hypothetical protein
MAAAASTRRIVGLAERMKAPRFLTLTVAGGDGELGPQLDRVLAHFREFRRRSAWRAHVRGGVAAVQTTRGKKGDRWHVHLHCLVDGEFWPQADISAEWLAVTGDSPIVDIRAVPDRERTAKYIARYVGRGSDWSGWSDDEVLDAAHGLAGRRLLLTFGTSHNARKEDDGQEDRPKLERHYCSVGRLIALAGQGCTVACDALQALAARGSIAAACVGADPEAELPPREVTGRMLVRERRIARELAGLLDEPPPEERTHAPPIERRTHAPPEGRLWAEVAPTAYR